MILELFTKLSEYLYASPLLAMSAAFVWGLLSVLLSPCHLASIPLIVAYLGGQKDMGIKRAFGLSAVFCLGFVVMMGLIGLITSLLGLMLGDTGEWVEPVVGSIFMLVAFLLADIIRLPILMKNNPRQKQRGYLEVFGLGFLIGIGLGPCSFAFMAPILGLVFGTSGTKLLYGIGLIIAYIIGHSLVLIAAGTFSGLIRSYLKWSNTSGAIRILRYICSIIVFLMGLYLVLKNYL